MTAIRFRRLLDRRPFQPFRVVMSSGERYEIRHPEMAFLTRVALYIGTNPDEEGIPDDAAWCSLLHITSVEPLGNGRAPKRKWRKGTS